jgi:hypothetical protein
MALYSPTFRLLVLSFYFFVLTPARDAIWKSPRSGEDITMVLNDEYLVEWESVWGSVDLYVFCDGAKYGGVGDDGAMLLYGKQ